MKLVHVKISNYRSFLGEHEFDLGDRTNFVVGPNNCGKSNLLAAIELAMDADSVFDPNRDRPASTQGIGGPARSRIVMLLRGRITQVLRRRLLLAQPSTKRPYARNMTNQPISADERMPSTIRSAG